MLASSDGAVSADLNSHGAMVLLVDDQVVVGEAIRRALVPEGNIDFHYCSDPYKALSVAILTRPTVILQDLVLPGVGGRPAADALAAGADPREVWLALCAETDVPMERRHGVGRLEPRRR